MGKIVQEQIEQERSQNASLRTCSYIFPILDKREIGRNSETVELFGFFLIGMILAVFQSEGKYPLFRQWLNKHRAAPKEINNPSTSSEAAKRIRSPEEENTAKPSKKKMSFPPSNAPSNSSQNPREGDCPKNPSTEGEKECSGTKKVSATAESSGSTKGSDKKPRAFQKRKMGAETGSEPPSTYAKVARKNYRDERCYAVIDTSRGSGRLPKEHQQAIENMVSDKILEHILKSGPIKIVSSELKGDLLVYHLGPHANPAALEEVINSVTTPWEGGKLKLVRKDEIPHLTKATVYVKGYGCKFETERMLEVFGKQNETLEVKRWEVFHREEKEDGTLLVVGIDDLSLSSLTKTKGKAYYICNAVTFKVGRARVGEEEEDAHQTSKEDKPPSNSEEGVEAISDSQEARLLDDS
ncbi:uncharacterized protein [Musca autumnalis]|uniref:uncharacterized protein n=1 Tax=Musca autumnalis TaxID=221902 RepID=UPI003CEA5D0C